MEYVTKLILGLIIIIIFSIVIILAIIDLIHNSGWLIVQDNDISNWVTLTAEIGAGIIIGIIFYFIQKAKTKKRKIFAMKKIGTDLVDLEEFNDLLQETINDFYLKKSKKEDFQHQLDILKQQVKKIETTSTVFSQDLDEDFISDLSALSFGVTQELPFLKNKWRDDGFVQGNKKNIEKILKKIDKFDINIIRNSKKERKELLISLMEANEKLKEILDEKGDIDPNKIPKRQKKVDHKGTFWFE